MDRWADGLEGGRALFCLMPNALISIKEDCDSLHSVPSGFISNILSELST